MAFYTNSQGLDISYKEVGDKSAKTIIFFDAQSASFEVFPNRMFDVLADRGYRCIAFDYRGYGKSSPSKHNSMAWCALDAKELLEYLQIENAVFYAGSMGVHVVLAYFKAYGDLYVDSIILFDQSPSCTSREDWPHGRLRGKQDMKKLMDTTARMFHDFDQFLADDGAEASPSAFTDIGLPPELQRDPLEIVAAAEDKSMVPLEYIKLLEMVEGGMTGIVDHLAMMGTFFDSSYQDFRPVVPTIKVPALILAPNPGSVNEFECNEYYRDNLGGPVTFVELKPGTHYALFEHAEKVEKEVIDFLAKL